MLPKMRFVVATRKSRNVFFCDTALGKSLSIYKFPFVELRLHEENSRGLPVLYNQAISEAKTDPAILIFVHDDVHLCDFYWPGQIINGLSQFDILGLAGNKRRLPNQPAWAFIDSKLTWDLPENLSGIVGHGSGFPPANISFYGDPCQEVKLLDGVMLVAHSDTLNKAGIVFDERFDFHFYDMDFCRQAERKQVRMGTWTISVIHESDGHFGSPSWQAAYKKYLDKWIF